ncbi:serine/threonine-protein kinase [Cryobacterium fucosi]|uniref:serine/threonine-protein kinase n=1 Tax=Cryobacterium fucosi TaxID=1259157 RepID=UPI00141BB5DF|nr:serine/threonine-protein kinase [Cryobacterium fucosi]
MVVGPTRRTPLSEPRIPGPIGLRLADRFRIDRLIGAGGMAVVYEATDVVLGRTVAVKLFRMDTADDAGPERQTGEVAVLASLNHFALVTLFDAGTAVIEGVPRAFIVMEFVNGRDLRSRISDGPVLPAEVAEIGADLGEALHYVHSQGIIHRDIKPANVLLAPSGFPGRGMHAKLADFGIARLFDATHLTKTGALLGTAGYLSPEQAMGEPIGPPSDVYSLGLVLLECLTGERAFPGSAVESAMARLQRDPVIPDFLDSGWAEVLGGMTSRVVAERFTAEQAAVRLRSLVAEPGPAAAAAHSVLDDVDGTELLEPTAQTALLEKTALLESTAQLDKTAVLENTALLEGSAPPDKTALLDRTAVLESAPAPRQSAADDWAAGRADAQTEFLPVGVRTGGTPLPPTSATAGRRPTRRTMVVVAVAVVLVALAAILFAPRPDAPAATPPSYPAVDGTLGTHLQQLQESLRP